ncbi:MAG: hypothetical protein EOM22_10455 [Gammaproteobacteria bacterium]|jgi:hypothetical protein|nr:hypothetical protein [Gammaproteobacteria bacterium]
MQVQSNPVDLFAWLPTRQWVAANGGHIFGTFSSFEWFARRHRAELIASGQFIPRPGRGGSLCGPELAAKVLEILRREAQQAA